MSEPHQRPYALAAKRPTNEMETEPIEIRLRGANAILQSTYPLTYLVQHIVRLQGLAAR